MNAKILDLPGNNEIIKTDLEPEQKLAVAIFNRAIMDLKEKIYRSEIINFVESEWAQVLVGVEISQEELRWRFEKIMKEMDA